MAFGCFDHVNQMEILLEAVRARQTRLAKAASLGRLLARRALPVSFRNARCVSRLREVFPVVAHFLRQKFCRSTKSENLDKCRQQ